MARRRCYSSEIASLIPINMIKRKKQRCLKLLLLVFFSVSLLNVLNLVHLNTSWQTRSSTDKSTQSKESLNMTIWEVRVQNARLLERGYNLTKNIVPTGVQISDKNVTGKNNSEPTVTLECNWEKDFPWKPEYDQHHYKYLITPSDICGSNARPVLQGGRNFSILILVASGMRNAARRDAQRRTWIQWSINQSLPTRTLFLLGASPDPKLMDAVRKEAEMHGDIVQEDFVDTYYNNTLKAIMAFKLAATICGDQVSYVMKMDDDAVLNVENLVRDLGGAPPEFHTDYIAGWCRSHHSVFYDAASKWCIPRRLFPDLPKIHRPFPLNGYVMTPDVVAKLYQRSQVSRLFPLDDVYVGMLLDELGLRMRDIGAFSLACHFVRSGGAYYIANEYSLEALTKGYLTWDISPEIVDFVWKATMTKRWPPSTRYD